MDNTSRWRISNENKEKYIDALTQELAVLRTKSGLSQDELASLAGVSRQTYGAIERNVRRMSWNTYLSLAFFFDYNPLTRDTLRSAFAFPAEFEIPQRESHMQIDVGKIAGITSDEIKNTLDEQAMHAIRTLIMIEYARCKDVPGEVVVKSFDGKRFVGTITKADVKIKKALKNIKENRK